MKAEVRCAILTISDRSFQGTRPDTSGPALVLRAQETGWQIVFTAIVPDDIPHIQEKIKEWCDNKNVDLILTTGGTGFAPRDVTPEATQPLLDRMAPGIAEAMRQASLQKTPHAMLSRGLAGIRRRTLVINLPGSPKAALENLEVVIPVIGHAVELLHEDPGAERRHQYPSV